jgi:hypothetical protein
MSYPILEIIRSLMATKDNLQLYHWNTKSYAKHKASDELISSLSKHVDKFVEVYLGSNPNNKIEIADISIKNYNDKQLTAALLEVNDMLKTLAEGTHQFQMRGFMRGSSKALTYTISSDLINIRDEIMGDIHRSLYLLTLS